MRSLNYVLGCMLLFFGLAFFSGESIAEEFSVNNSFTFQEALNSAQSNDADDTIYLKPATYLIFELLTYWSKQEVGGQPPHIENYSLTIDGGNYTKTILDGNDNAILLIDTHAVPEAISITVTIKNITFKNAGSGPLLSIAGKAVFIRIENCAFIDNKGGVVLLNTDGGITVINSTFNGNIGGYQGAGVFLASDTGILSLENNTFIGNNSATEGGGAYCIIRKEGLITVSNNVFKDNHATSIGAGLAIIAMNGGQIHLAQNTFENNRVGDKGGGAYLCSYDVDRTASITLTENTFTANTAMHGGGAYVFANKAQLGITHSIFEQNQAGLKGGAVFSETKNSGVSFINSIIAKNTAHEGGGIYAQTDSGEIVITNTTCINNTLPTGGTGGGVYAHLLYNISQASVYNSILRDNTAGTQGDDVYINDDGDEDRTGATVQLHHNAYARLAVRDGDHMTATHTITADPVLTSDYHLQSGSPCIDAGSNTAPQIPDKDMDFGDRIIDGDEDGESIVDIGADEYDPSTPHTTTTSTIPPPECMIRTIYGEQAEEVATLRRFRDEIIAPTPMGNTMIALYYRLSSFMAETVKGNSVFQHEVKWFIDKILWVVNRLVEPTKLIGETQCAQRRNLNT